MKKKVKPAPPPTAKRGVGRPPGKRTDKENYSQHSVWLSHKVHAEVQHALILPDGKRYEFSKLVEHRLREWLDAGGKLPKE